MSIKWGIDFQNGKPFTDNVREEYVGAVLATRERNYYDDSDFYAVVWDEEEQRVKNVEYGSTRYGGGGNAVIDATPATLEKARAYLAPIIARAEIAASQARYEERVREFKAFHTGTPVRVIRTIKSRKQGVIPEGFAGVLVWKGEPYHHGGYDRYGVKDPESGRCVFVDSKDIEYAGPEPTEEDIRLPLTMKNDYERVLDSVKNDLKNAKGYELGRFSGMQDLPQGVVLM